MVIRSKALLSICFRIPQAAVRRDIFVLDISEFHCRVIEKELHDRRRVDVTAVFNPHAALASIDRLLTYANRIQLRSVHTAVMLE